MEITEVRVAVREGAVRPGAGEGHGADRRLKGYATITFDQCFVVRNIKIIEGRNGLFVAMPSHKPKAACGKCRFKNDLGGRYCVQCGSALSRPMGPVEGAAGEPPAETQAHRDIAHPITAAFRHYLQETILAAYEAERAKGQQSNPSGMQTAHEAS